VACRSNQRNARYKTVISSAEYGSTNHAPNAANPSARPNETTHNDPKHCQRPRVPSESFLRDITQNSDPAGSGGIPVGTQAFIAEALREKREF
jgi:hypothetical protein